MRRKIAQTKPRCNEGPLHYQNSFAITRFRYIEVLFHGRTSRTREGGVPQLSRFTHPRKFGNHVTVYRASERQSTRQGNQYLLSHFLASFGAYYGLLLHINVKITWQWSKHCIHWPVSFDRIADWGVDPSRTSIFWIYPLTSYLFSNDRWLKFMF